MADQIPLREELEKRGAKVAWKGLEQPIEVQYGGQTFQLGPSDYEMKWDPTKQTSYAIAKPETLAKVMGYIPVRSTLESSGFQEVVWDQTTGQVKAKKDGQQFAFQPTAVWGGTSYMAPTDLQKAMSGAASEKPPWEQATTEIKQEYAQTQQDVRNYANQYFGAMNNYIMRASDAAVAAYKTYQEEFGQAIALLMQQIQQEPKMPESVTIALSELQDIVNRNVALMTEEMNRRNVLQSGLTTVQDRELRERGVKEAQKILAGWLDREHEKLTQAIFALAQMRAQGAATAADLQYRTSITPIQMGMELAGKQFEFQTSMAEKAFDLSAKLRQWSSEQAGAAEERALKQWETEQKYGLDWARLEETIRHNRALEALSAEATRQRADYQGWLKSRGVTDEQVKQNTNAAIMDILQMQDEEGQTALNIFYDYLAENQVWWRTTVPVDIAALLPAIRYKFPGEIGEQIILRLGGS